MKLYNTGVQFLETIITGEERCLYYDDFNGIPSYVMESYKLNILTFISCLIQQALILLIYLGVHVFGGHPFHIFHLCFCAELHF